VISCPARDVLPVTVMGLVEYGRYGQDIRDRAFRFGCRIVIFCRRLDEEGGVARTLAPQLVRCGTSIGANLEEARGGESRRDFKSKCAISLKEARELAAILGAIVRNSRRSSSDEE